jgi:cellulose synthase/poly-beta-1,6-N-acetylglucosamine synthase-like glycosyltransferase
MEIILARGKQPSVQRNMAVEAATGDLIYFLDDDSVPPVDNLKRAVAHFADPAVKMVGGPNLCPPDAPEIEQVFALVHATWLAFGPSRARYFPVGTVRDSSEKELILCNMVIKRSTMIECGGFNEALYPNEENALMDEIQKRGGRLIYDPEFMVHRRPRNTINAFRKMLINYGRGRAEQFRSTPTAGSLANFVPPAFFAYLILLLVGFGLGMAGAVHFPKWFASAVVAPMGLYAVAVLIQGLWLISKGGLVRGICAVPFVVLTHVLYGYGFWKGLFTPLKSNAAAIRPTVVLEKVDL